MTCICMFHELNDATIGDGDNDAVYRVSDSNNEDDNDDDDGAYDDYITA